nr:hypothetical chloroplast RF15, chloroplastic [Tanacetum cinerariifolium]
MVIHTKKTGMIRLVVEIEYDGKIADVFDKATWSFDGLQPEQVDLNYFHALNEPQFHDIRVVPNKHEVDQHLSFHHNVYNPSSSIPQVEYALSVHQQSDFSQPDTGLVFPVFQKGDDPIDAINHMMSFLTAVVTSRYPPTNNQPRNSSNPRQQATINNERVTVQPIQGRQNSLAADFEKIDSPFQQTSSLKPYVLNVILEKIIIDLEDEVVSLLEKEKANLEIIESLKSKDLDTFSSVRRPKQSSVIWKKKGSSNTSNDDLSSVSHSKLNKDVKRYSRKDLLSCNNSHLGETSSAYVCNDAMNVSCNSRLCDSFDVNNLFIFDDKSVRISPVSKMPFRKKPRNSMNNKRRISHSLAGKICGHERRREGWNANRRLLLNSPDPTVPVWGTSSAKVTEWALGLTFGPDVGPALGLALSLTLGLVLA